MYPESRAQYTVMSPTVTSYITFTGTVILNTILVILGLCASVGIPILMVTLLLRYQAKRKGLSKRSDDKSSTNTETDDADGFILIFPGMLATIGYLMCLAISVDKQLPLVDAVVTSCITVVGISIGFTICGVVALYLFKVFC